MMKNQNNRKPAADAFVLQFRKSPIIERRHILDVSLPLLIEKSISPEMERYFKGLREFLEYEYRRVIVLMTKYGVKTVAGVNVVFMPEPEYRSVRMRSGGPSSPEEWIFVSGKLPRRRIGREIRKGLRYFKRSKN